MHRRRLLPLALALASCLALPLLAPRAALADIVYQSASAGTPVSTFAGNLSMDNAQWLAARVTLTNRTQIDAIGAHLLAVTAGQTIFAAIVPLELDGFPIDPVGINPPDLASVALASTSFVAPTGLSADVLGAVDVLLEPGTYGLVLGAGVFGATGFSTMPKNNNDVVPAPSRFFWEDSGNVWADLTSTGTRFIVEGTTLPPIPVMGGGQLVLFCLVLLGGVVVGAGVSRGRLGLR